MRVEELTIKELNKRKVPIVRIDSSLDKYDHIVLFPEKVAKSNAMLSITGLPANIKKS